jgi:hypothetical protein
LKRWAVIWLAGLMLMAGCASTPRAVQTTAPAAAPAPREESNHLQPLDTKPTTPPPAPKAEDPAARILAVADPASSNPEDMRWVGIDEQNQLVLAVGTDADRSLRLERRLARWMKNYPVDRMIFYSDEGEWGIPLEAWGATSLVTRQRYSEWPTKPDGETTLAISEWKGKSNLFGERNQPLPWATRASLENEMRGWLVKRVGERLVRFELTQNDNSGTSNPNRISYRATITLKALLGSDQQRLQDAAALAALLIATTHTSGVLVQYDAANGPRTVETSWGPLMEWRRTGGKLEYLAGFLKVDGVVDKSKMPPSPNASHFTPADLSAILNERDQLRKLVPTGARLTIGQRLRGDGGVVALEADIDPSRSWEDVWTSYHQVSVRLFKQEPRLERVVLILRRGQEVQFLDIRGDYLDLQAKLGLADIPAPSVFPLTGAYFDQYTLTGG